MKTKVAKGFRFTRENLIALGSEVLADLVLELAERTRQREGDRYALTSKSNAMGGNPNMGGTEYGLNPVEESELNLGKSFNLNLNPLDSALPEVTRETPPDFEQRRREREEEVLQQTLAFEYHKRKDGGELSVNGKQSGYTLEFEKFWEFYPRKVGKRAAFKAFKAAKNRSPLELIMEAVEVYSKSNKGRGDFCPHPSTWLNEERYDDDRDEWNRKEDRILRDYEKEFNVFYEHYPRKGSRAAALECFADAIDSGHDAEKILEAVGIFKHTRKAKSRMCPSASSFLKGEWFLDDPAKWNEDWHNEREATSTL